MSLPVEEPQTAPQDARSRLLGWPAEEPLGALLSAGSGPWAARSRLCPLGRRVGVYHPADLPALWDALGPRGSGDGPGGWVGWLSYELGPALEPAAGRVPTGGAPLAEFWRVDDPILCAPLEPGRPAGGHRVGPLVSEIGREAYEAAVARALEYIAAGDIYQVNLTHTLSAAFEGCPRALAADAVARTGAWFGGYLDAGDRAIVSTSPELLVRVTPGGEIVTRPIKGTRPAGGGAALAASEKDAAELAMIVDLMRHDLGRVCALGSVRVEAGREIEPHAGVVHGVATVSGRLRPDAGWEDVLRAVFPAGSITGAPKIRAMRVIKELEGRPRGAYCGSLIWAGDDGSLDMNVGIRTAEIAGGRLRFGVGAGIVADSDPAAEWEETLSKAEGFVRACEDESGAPLR